MGKLGALWKRLQGIFDAKHGNDFSGELDSHLEMHIEDNLRSGMSSEQARRDALIKLGGAEQAKQAYRERRRLPLLDSLVQDVHFGLRILRRGPEFTAVAVLTSAVGIGANTAIFSFVDALFLKPLPVSHPENLIRIYAEGPSGHYGDLDGRSIADVKSSPLFKVST